MVSAMLKTRLLLLAIYCLSACQVHAEDLGSMWGTAKEESKYYELVSVPIPDHIPLKVGSFDVLPDGRLVVGNTQGRCLFH